MGAFPLDGLPCGRQAGGFVFAVVMAGNADRLDRWVRFVLPTAILPAGIWWLAQNVVGAGGIRVR